MSETRIYNSEYFNGSYDPFDGNDENLGLAPFVIPLITAAPSMLQSVLGIFGVGQRKAQFQGLAEINAAGQQATQAMQQILAGVSSGQMSPSQAVSEAQKIVQQFNDPSIVYPAKKGDDAAARNQYISQLNVALQQIQGKAASMPAGGGAAGSIGGISTNTLLLVGGGLLMFSMLKK